MKTIDLSGEWLYKISEQGELDKFILPGSTCDNKIGKKQEYYDEFTKEAVRAPREKYEYIAPIWLQKEVDIPSSFEGKCIRLFLERVNIASQLWIDGEQIDRQIIELSAPHIYNLTGKLTSGTHTFTLCIDNRNLINIGTMASGYSIDTQGYWNGVIGRIELQCEEIFHLENVQVYPAKFGIDIRLTAVNDVRSPRERRTGDFEFCVTTPSGKVLEAKRFSRTLFNSRQVEDFNYAIEDIQYWDEFTPDLYTLSVKYTCDGITDEKTIRFGIRSIKTENKQILLNNKPVALRGTIDCAIYPLTGYPPMDIEVWRKNFTTIKAYGLNHVRFHAWCPPEAAFCAADELGIYLSVEMPLWLNRDVCPLELGEDSAHRAYFSQEALTISKTYGNHPSFVMFSNGNENMGDFELLEDITTQIKAYDKRRIYTLTTNFDHSVRPCEDYLCAFEAGGHPVRIQQLHDTVAESTTLDYTDAVENIPVPIIGFEVGQYCVYPDVDAIEKYTGNMLPVNLDVIRKSMKKKGVYHRLGEFIKASGDLAVKLYKEDIEATMRTKNFGGFELLSLSDYTGQSTATVGILDSFYDSKDIISPEDFRKFCNSVVPLFKAKRIFTNTETLEAELDLYDYGQHRIEETLFELKIYNGDNLFYETKTTKTKVSIPLSNIQASACLNVQLTVNGYSNDWNIYVYTDNKADDNIRIVKTKAELEELIENGGYAIASAECFDNTIEGSFIPVFWSPVHFPSQKPCGAIVDETHPIFKEFPTQKYPDYQWKRLLDYSKGVDISKLSGEIKPIVETVPNFVDNTPSSPLFEVKIKNARLIVCGFDLEQNYPEVQAFKTALYNFASNSRACK